MGGAAGGFEGGIEGGADLMVVYFVMFLLIVMLPSALIVWFWRGRPVLSLVIAGIVLALIALLPGIIKTFQAMMIYGEGDPQLIAGAISHSIVNAILLSMIGVPFLAWLGWMSRRRHRRKPATPDVDTTFS